MGRAIEIVDVSPRDGLQNEPARLPTETKLELVRRLAAAGVRRIEAASFVNPERVPQMADAEAVAAGLPDGVEGIGLVLNVHGVRRALATPIPVLNFAIAATDAFARRNQGRPVAALLEQWAEAAALAHSAGRPIAIVISTAFGCPFEGEVPPERVVEIVERALATPPDELALADTIGVGVPRQVRDLTERVTASAPGVPLRMHFHNTRNTGYANALAAVESGVRVLDASAGGIGGCPFAPAATGNIATEDLLYALHRSGMRTGLDLAATAAAGTWICERLGKTEAPALLGRAGDFPAATG